MCEIGRWRVRLADKTQACTAARLGWLGRPIYWQSENLQDDGNLDGKARGQSLSEPLTVGKTREWTPWCMEIGRGKVIRMESTCVQGLNTIELVAMPTHGRALL